MTRGSRLGNILFVALLILVLWMISGYLFSAAVTDISYSDLVGLIKENKVASVVIKPDASQIFGELVPGESLQPSNPKFKDRNQFKTNLPPNYETLVALLVDNGVKVEVEHVSAWSSLFSPTTLFMLLLFALPILFVYMLLSRQIQSSGGNQAFTFGKSKARIADEKGKRVTFADVAGVDEAIEELQEIVDFLKNPRKYQEIGAEIPKGILLIGPPGCGKTLLAKAIAGEAGVPFLYISGSDFVEMFVGVGASRVRDLFEQAKKQTPCLIFVDELDAVGRQRGAGLGGGHDEREQTLNQLLVELDGFEPNSGIILLAATNRPDILDPALLRPGRFDRRVVVDRPDLGGRKGILKIHLRNKAVTPDVDIDVLSRRTPGFSGADLYNVCNEAALLAARQNKKVVSMAEFEEAIDKTIAGPERKSRVISEREKEIIAYHELGHAVVAYHLPSADPVHKISILSRGMALGYTLQLPEEDRFLATKQQMLERISGLLGGRVAEELKFHEISTGATNDLERSTEIARAMVTQYGMSEKLGPLTFGKKHESVFLGRDLSEDRNYSEQIAYDIDLEVKHIISECYDRARSILVSSMGYLDKLAKILLEKEHLGREEFENLMKNFGAASA
ncbi:MAG: ATP-dependent metallopeptidase FtsH/Yme1/Tma family protein [bacterium]|jgi:cell division protease FtsH